MSAPELMTDPPAVTTTAHAPHDPSQPLPDHLVRLSDDWALWRWVGLRGAGFPVSQASLLAAPAAMVAADAVLDGEDEVERLREAAIQATRAERSRVDGVARRRAHETIEHLRKIDRTRPVASPLVAERFPELAAACARVWPAHDAYQHAYASETERIAEALDALTQDDRFREAVLWQNRGAVHRAFEPRRARRTDRERRNAKIRQGEHLLVGYLQRYTTKNDTIGFFGPVGWATLSPADRGLVMRPGAHLVAERHVYFEGWAIDTLIATLVKDPRFEPWLLPRREYTVDVDTGRLITAKGEIVPVSPSDEALLRACDGDTTVRAIAARLTADPSLELKSEADVLARLRELRDREWIALTIAVPMEMHPDRTLARLLGRIDDDEVRAYALGALEELQQARARVAAAAGRPADLDAALGALEETFTRLTGAAPTRSGGKTYAARTLVYEDCRRDLDVVIGGDVLDQLRAPLELMLTSSRWLTFEGAIRYTSLFTSIYRGLAQAAGTDTVPFVGLLSRALNTVLGKKNEGPAHDVQAEFQRRWARVLDPPAGSSRLEYTSEQLRPLVNAAFDAPGPGWQFGRYHSPDVMIAAPSAEAIARGDYLIVLGELHTGTNTLGCPLFTEQHVDGDALRRAGAIDLPEPRLEPVVPKAFWPGQAARGLSSLLGPRDYRIELCTEPCGADPSHVLPVSRLCVTQVRDQIVVRTREGGLEFDLRSVMAQLLTWLIVSKFRLLPAAPHQPRVTIDRVVVSRESWSFAPKAMTFAFDHDEANRFRSARRWLREHTLPRDVFVRVPTEKKPFHVDFASPSCVSMLAKAVRLSAEHESPNPLVTLSEMLPGKDESWLIDREGQHYTAELRVVAVDQRPHVR